MTDMLKVPGWNFTKGNVDAAEWLFCWRRDGEPRHITTDDGYNLFGICGKPLGWMHPDKAAYHNDPDRPLCEECAAARELDGQALADTWDGPLTAC